MNGKNLNVMKKITWLVLLNLIIMGAIAQKTITFPSLDGLTITADFYESKKTDPYIVLFHQARFSRGEYKETADKLLKLGYNCLAVDLRSGGEVNFVKNETAGAAQLKGLPTEYLDAKQDMQAAIDFAYKQSKKPVVIFGSSYSASLSLLLAKENNNINAVIVFSPGEYFNKENMIRDTIQGLSKPIFASSSSTEFPYMKELLSKVDQNNLTLFSPSKGKGDHGSKVLWGSNPDNSEYWLSLMMFFNQIK
jgi:pimeloyl-ACP methyl ester carboxylesterase